MWRCLFLAGCSPSGGERYEPAETGGELGPVRVALLRQAGRLEQAEEEGEAGDKRTKPEETISGERHCCPESHTFARRYRVVEMADGNISVSL